MEYTEKEVIEILGWTDLTNGAIESLVKRARTIKELKLETDRLSKLHNFEVFETESDVNDFLVELEDSQGNIFMCAGIKYIVSNDVTDFIREYGHDTFSQMCTSIDKLLDNALINEI